MLQAWRDISIVKKLNLVVGSMAGLVALQLAVLYFAMHTLSAVRAFVQAEGLWSKSQKNAVHFLQRYALTRQESQYRAFLKFLEVPRGYRRSRLELQKSKPDVPNMNVALEGFRHGKIHRDDISRIIDLIRRFRRIPYIAQSMGIWEQADVLIDQLEELGRELHAVKYSQYQKAWEILGKIEVLDYQLTELEEQFSNSLGEWSRWLENLLMGLLTFMVFVAGAIGVFLSALTGRSITKGLEEISGVVKQIECGDFSKRVKVRSVDEVGLLSERINRMAETLQFNIEGRKEAVSAVHDRDEFMSIASHELKTPLTALSLQLQILERRVKGLTDKDLCIEPALKNSRKQTARLSNLIDELLDLTRLRSGLFELKPECFELRNFIQDLAVRLKPMVEALGCVLSVAAGAPILGQWDRNRLEQVLTNLISNAAKYGNGRPIDISIEAVDDRVKIKVQDRGLGIAPEEQAMIFERYQRASSGQRMGGLGLGLYITCMIVEAQGGKINVESKINRGSIFIVELPVDHFASQKIG